MNSTLDWLDFYENQKCIIWHKKCYKNCLLRCILKNSAACFIVLYIIRYSEYCTCVDFARMQIY